MNSESNCNVILFAVLTPLLLVTACKGIRMESIWTETPISVDGRAEDWSGIGSAYLEENNVSISFANDSARLYLLLRLRDPRTAAMIRRSGLTIWIDAAGGKSKDFRICYREGPSREDIQALTGAGNPPTGGREPDFMTSDTNRPVFTCFQEGRIAEMGIPPDGSLGPTAAFSVDHGLFSYEFSWPLQESVVRYYGLGVSPGQRIGIGAKWGGRGADRGGLPGRDGRMGGMPPGGGGGGDIPGGMPGGLGGGPLEGGFGGQPDMLRQQDVRLKVTLAEADASGR